MSLTVQATTSGAKVRDLFDNWLASLAANLAAPILDGGQALIIMVEGVKRSPISLRSREIVQQIGLTFILMLMGLAFWNDLSRHWSVFVEWLRDTGL